MVQSFPEDIARIYETRLCLEKGIAPSMMELASQKDIDDVTEIHTKKSEHIHTMSPTEYSALNKNFHLRLNSISNNDYLKRYAQEILNRISLLLIYYDNSSNSKDSVLRHEKMIKALKTKDLDALIRAIHNDAQLANYQ